MWCCRRFPLEGLSFWENDWDERGMSKAGCGLIIFVTYRELTVRLIRFDIERAASGRNDPVKLVSLQRSSQRPISCRTKGLYQSGFCEV